MYEVLFDFDMVDETAKLQIFLIARVRINGDGGCMLSGKLFLVFSSALRFCESLPGGVENAKRVYSSTITTVMGICVMCRVHLLI